MININGRNFKLLIILSKPYCYGHIPLETLKIKVFITIRHFLKKNKCLKIWSFFTGTYLKFKK